MFLHNFDSGVKFGGENLCGKFFSREIFFADREKKTQKFESAKI